MALRSRAGRTMAQPRTPSANDKAAGKAALADKAAKGKADGDVPELVEEVPQENALQSLNDELNKALRPKGTGPGEFGGPGGPGRGNPNIRTKRGLRWDMGIDYSSAQDYLMKLSALGAQIGLPKPGT